MEDDKKKKLKDRIPNNHHYSVISFYVVITFIIIFILTRIGDNLDHIAMAVGAGLHWLGVILVPLALGFALAYLFAPVVRFFQKRIAKIPLYRKHNRSGLGTSVAVTFLLVAAGVALSLTFLISAFTHEMTMVSFDSITGFVKELSNSLNDVYSQLQDSLRQLDISSDALENVVQTVSAWAGGIAARAGQSVSNALGHVTGFLANGLFAVIFAIYFSLDAEGLKKYWKRVLRSLIPEKGYGVLATITRDADRVFSGYIRGQLIDALFMAVAMSIALLLVNVKFAVIIGLLTGFGNLIPYVGPIVAYGGTILSGFLSQDLEKTIISIVVVFILQTIDGNVINPRLLSNQVQLHPMLVIIALLIGSKVGGLSGMILAVPVAALLKVWFDRWVGILARRKQKAGPSDAPRSRKADSADVPIRQKAGHPNAPRG